MPATILFIKSRAWPAPTKAIRHSERSEESLTAMYHHTIPFRQNLPSMRKNSLAHDWMNEWKNVPALSIDQMREESHITRPHAEAKMICDGEQLTVFFRVVEAGVIVRETQPNGQVWRDSCVELFLQPPHSDGYFNFECNAGGCVHASFVTNWQRNAHGDVTQRRILLIDQLQQIAIYHNLPELIDPPSLETTEWYLAMVIPQAVLQCDVPTAEFSAPGWRGNLYKCAEHGPYPHWLSWSPLAQLNFHAPEHFGEFYFETVPV